MIFACVMIALIALIGIGIAGFCILGIKEEGGAGWIIGLIATLLIAIAICSGIAWWLYNTESGRRAIKDTQSNIEGGIERTVTVYDINGEIIKEYSGKFDVSYDSERIKFDDENGKRHVIYCTTGTVTIDES